MESPSHRKGGKEKKNFRVRSVCGHDSLQRGESRVMTAQGRKEETKEGRVVPVLVEQEGKDLRRANTPRKLLLEPLIR